MGLFRKRNTRNIIDVHSAPDSRMIEYGFLRSVYAFLWESFGGKIVHSPSSPWCCTERDIETHVQTLDPDYFERWSQVKSILLTSGYISSIETILFLYRVERYFPLQLRICGNFSVPLGISFRSDVWAKWNVQWNRKFPEFPNFWKKGQAREAAPKFTKRTFRQFLLCFIWFCAGDSGNFVSMDRAPHSAYSVIPKTEHE